MAINNNDPSKNPVLSSKSENAVEQLYFGMAEKTLQISPYDRASQLRPYNSDEIYQKTGDYTIYEDMLNDDQVEVCLKLKKDLVLASGWDIESKEGEDEEISEFLEVALKERFSGNFDDALEELLTAYEFGFSITEKVFTKDGESIILKKLCTRHPAPWILHTDDYGNVSKYEQQTEKANIVVDGKSLIHYINQPRFQNPYGKSDLRAAYNAWFIKRQIIKYFAIFLEKAASPTPVAKYDTAAPANAVEAIHNAIKTLQTKTALTIPKGIELEFLETTNSGDAYHKAINLFNMFIGRALFVPDLIGLQGSETAGGSYALGKDQIAIFVKHINRRREKLEQIVNKHIIQPLVIVNFGDIKDYPKFKLKPVSDDHALEYAKTFLEAVKAKFYDVTDEEINHFRSLIKFPEGEINRPDPVQPQPLNLGGDPTEKPLDKMGEKEPKEKPEKYAKAHQSPYMKKVNFAAIKSQMDTFTSKTVDKAEPVLRKIVDDLYKQIERKRPIETKRADKLSELKPKYMAELKAEIKAQYQQAYKDAYNLGERELNKATFRTPIPDEKFMDFLEGELDGVLEDWGAGLTKKARTRVMEAIRDGKPLSEVFDVFDAEDYPDMISSVERMARTKFTEIMNKGRLASFNDSGVVAAYEYSAILDDRTTEICAGLDGKIFENGDQPVPPMHWNCRSLLVPITKYEEYKADTKVGSKNIDQFIEDNKGEGFSRYMDLSKPKVTDSDSTYVIYRPTPTQEVYVYSKNGVEFKRTTVNYKDNAHDEILSVNHEDVNK